MARACVVAARTLSAIRAIAALLVELAEVIGVEGLGFVKAKRHRHVAVTRLRELEAVRDNLALLLAAYREQHGLSDEQGAGQADRAAAAADPEPGGEALAPDNVLAAPVSEPKAKPKRKPKRKPRAKPNAR